MIDVSLMQNNSETLVTKLSKLIVKSHQRSVLNSQVICVLQLSLHNNIRYGTSIYASSYTCTEYYVIFRHAINGRHVRTLLYDKQVYSLFSKQSVVLLNRIFALLSLLAFSCDCLA